MHETSSSNCLLYLYGTCSLVRLRGNRAGKRERCIRGAVRVCALVEIYLPTTPSSFCRLTTTQILHDSSRHSDQMLFHSSRIAASTTDTAYTAIFVGAIALSVLTFAAVWFYSLSPVFSKFEFHVRRFVGFGVVPTQPDNDIEGDLGDSKEAVEPFSGWRLGMGVLLNITFVALTVVHTLILIENDGTSFQIVFVIYWVCPFFPLC